MGEPLQLVEGGIYRAKKPSQTGFGYVNDRVILRLWEKTLQYDSPSIGSGRHYSTITIEKFVAWAGEKIDIPGRDWCEWDAYQKSKRKSKV